MSGGTLVLAVAGIFGFFVGAYLAATGDHRTGVMMMALGLMFQVLCLRQLRQARLKDQHDARR
ncbi:hypothetical protein [Erythrobacter rubeus]|uniref:Uncharacterized protein n=1 Tax=Erythrobacter rubeus TaxID=2760803 RepID=A0ABR8KRJ6_9SPHN|nr:hypothetical protein [Erythrobacter rubeus]MBD2841698.1 hypothetical protein [Erythrobacter rubeus]